jgi:hypothetical protein
MLNDRSVHITNNSMQMHELQLKKGNNIKSNSPTNLFDGHPAHQPSMKMGLAQILQVIDSSSTIPRLKQVIQEDIKKLIFHTLRSVEVSHIL